jgi:hypothetical protein
MSKDRKVPQPSVLLSVLALVVGLAACDQPSMTGPVPPDQPIRSVMDALPGASAVGEGTRAYFCSTSRRIGVSQGGEFDYEYGLIRIRYREQEYTHQARGEEVQFLVRVTDRLGETEWAAWCWIPRSQASVQRTLIRLGLQGHVAAREVLALSQRRGHPRKADEFGATWHEGDDDAEPECPPGYMWYPDTGKCEYELDEIIVNPPPPLPPPPSFPPDPDPEPHPGEPPGGGGDGSGSPLPPPPPGDDCEADGPCLPPYWHDETDDLSTTTPDCSPHNLPNLKYEEHLWCAGNLPGTTQLQALAGAASSIIARCPFLEEPWNRVQGNIRTFFGPVVRAEARPLAATGSSLLTNG